MDGRSPQRLPRRARPFLVVLGLLILAAVAVVVRSTRTSRSRPTTAAPSPTPARTLGPTPTHGTAPADATAPAHGTARPAPDRRGSATPTRIEATAAGPAAGRRRSRVTVAAGLVALCALAVALIADPRSLRVDGGPADVAAPVTTTPTVSLEPPPPDCTRLKCVALTFDDGPDATSTPRLLDILEKHGSTATFFVVGYAIEGNEQILKRMTRLGMEVANHTWDHPNLAGLSRDGVLRQLARTDAEIVRATGREPTYMRPPYGSWTPGATATGGLRPVIWEVDPQDWLYRSGPVVSRNVLDRVSPGAVILLHDIHASTVDAVPAILDGLDARGYTVVSLDDLYAARPDCPVHLYCSPATTSATPTSAVTTTRSARPAIDLVNAEATG